MNRRSKNGRDDIEGLMMPHTGRNLDKENYQMEYWYIENSDETKRAEEFNAV